MSSRVLKDQSGGLCRSHRLGANIVDDILYMLDLDGALVPSDGNGSYLVEVDLKHSFALNVGAKYSLDLVGPQVPILKDQALWSDQANTTLYTWGGRDGRHTSATEVWAYTIANQSWSQLLTSTHSTRFAYGAHVDAPSIQSAYWLGGYQDNAAVTDEKVFAEGLIQFNTTTEEFTQLEAPFTPVQNGALVYIPVGELGVLVFFGGEVPSAAKGDSSKMTPNYWSYVHIYDIANKRWYKQKTTGEISSKTQFCAVVQHDPTSSSYQIYAIGGADYESKEASSKVFQLSIPSFKWYHAGNLDKERMTHTCEAYGRQVFVIGGRREWTDNSTARCSDTPVLLYDTVLRTQMGGFFANEPGYQLTGTPAQDIAASPYPSKWASESLKNLFAAGYPPSTYTAIATPPSSAPSTEGIHSGGKPVGGIVGGVVGGVAGPALVMFLSLLYRRRQSVPLEESASTEALEEDIPAEPKPPMAPRELDASNTRYELAATRFSVYELGTDNQKM